MTTPIVFWAISGFLFLWGVAYAGLVVFSFGLATPDHWAGLVEQGRIKPEYADYILNIPQWVVAITAVAALTRLMGGAGLLLHKTWALPVYTVSLVCVVILMFRGFVLADVTSVIRPSQVWLEVAFLALTFFAVWWARHQVRAGLLT